jgi:predicted nucleic acid-binding protein
LIYLLDTTAFSDFVRDRPRMDARMASLSSDDRLIICSIVLGEVLYGLERLSEGRRRSELEKSVSAILQLTGCEPVPAAAANHYAVAKRARQRAGIPLDENDLWIAATALALGAVLVTRDSDLLRHIEGLQVENWKD